MIAYTQHKFLSLSPDTIFDGPQRRLWLDLIVHGRSDGDGKPIEPRIEFCLYPIGQSYHVGYAGVGQIYLVADVARNPGKTNHEADYCTMWWFEHLGSSILRRHIRAYHWILAIMMDVRA